MLRKRKIGDAAMNKLITVTVIGLLFTLVEALGGLISGSLAILTDAAHQLSDVAGFVISIFALAASKQPANMSRTYGNNRYDVLGALCSVFLIWILS